MHLQAAISAILPGELKNYVSLWLDDVMLFDRTVQGLLERIDILSGCATSIGSNFILKIRSICTRDTMVCTWYIQKWNLFWAKTTSEPDRHRRPKNEAPVQQFLGAMQWVKNAIPNFTSMIIWIHLFVRKFSKVAEKELNGLWQKCRWTCMQSPRKRKNVSKIAKIL